MFLVGLANSLHSAEVKAMILRQPWINSHTGRIVASLDKAL